MQGYGAHQVVQKREKREKSCRERECSVLGRTQNSQDPQTSSSQPGSQTPVPPGKGWAKSARCGCALHPSGKEMVPARAHGQDRRHSFLTFSLLSSQYFWLLSGRKVLPSTILVYLLRERNILPSPPKFDHWEQKY